MSELTYLAAAYAAIWVAFFGYSLYLAKRLKRLEGELELLNE